MDQAPVGNWVRFKRGGLRVLGAFLVLAATAMGVLVVVPAVSPSTGAQVADSLRAVLGPDAVASIETVSFRIQDVVNQRLYSVTGNKPGITLDNQNSAQITTAKAFSILPMVQSGENQNSAQSTTAKTATILETLQADQNISTDSNAVTALPQAGWQDYGPNVAGEPAMAQALLALDPQRPYAAIALVRVDLSKLQLNVMPGFLEPSHDPNILKAIPNVGVTPASDLSRLVAGFNGGFKAVNGHYGMMVDGVTLLPAVPGIGTIAIYKDGQVRMGTWGSDILPSIDMIAYRQNCPPIIQAGQINPLVAVDNRAVWGDTIGNQEITWRTAFGLTQDGRYLIYAVGNATSVSTLAQALQEAGVYSAMQLDINRHYSQFVTYQTGPKGSLSAVQLLGQMENIPTLYLVAHSRDYFYLTIK